MPDTEIIPLNERFTQLLASITTMLFRRHIMPDIWTSAII